MRTSLDYWRKRMPSTRKPKLTDEENWKVQSEQSSEDLKPSHFKVRSTGEVEKMSGNMIDPTEWGLGDIPEPEVLPDGEEAKVRIISVIDAETKNGGIPYWRVTLEIPDSPRVKDFSYNLYKPHDGQSQKESFRSKYNIQQFMKAFQLDMTRPFDPSSDWIGEEAWAIVGMREDPEYGKQNSIRKWGPTPK
jgi:hypothetical protein